MKLRLRLSLLNLLLLTAIISQAIVVGLLWREVGPLRDEVARHRDALGVFEIGDRERIHAIRLPDQADASRIYRVYLPPGRRYQLRYKANGVPEEGLPEASTPTDLSPGGYLISVKLQPQFDRETSAPMPAVRVRLEVEPTDGGLNSKTSATIGISESQNDWIINRETGALSYGFSEIGRSLETSPARDPLVLYRARASEVVVMSRHADGSPNSWSSEPVHGECDGFMVWIGVAEEPPR